MRSVSRSPLIPLAALVVSSAVRTRIVVALLLAAVVAAGCGESLEGKLGGELYEAGCARCHASDGSGGVGPSIGEPDSNAALELTDEQIVGTIRVGPGRMPSFDRLDDDQVESLVVYLRSLQADGTAADGG